MAEKEVKKEKTQLLYIVVGVFILVSVGLSLVFSFVDFENLNNPAEDSDDGNDESDPTTDNSTSDDGG